MNNKWDFKIELKDYSVFDKLATHYDASIPEEIKVFIIFANASNPESNLIDINGVERVFETVLSFNENEPEAVSVFSIIKNDSNKAAIPFGLDPFGNVFYYSFTDRTIQFYDHEEERYDKTNYSLSQFLSKLYKD